MRESDFQSRFSGWLRDGWQGGAAAFELKIVKCRVAGRAGRYAGGEGYAAGEVVGALPYAAVEEGQVEALMRCKHGGSEGLLPLAYKISDMAAGYKPFDCFVMARGTPAYVVALYWLAGDRRGRAGVFMVDVDVWASEVAEGRRVGRASLSLARMRGIGVVVEL